MFAGLRKPGMPSRLLVRLRHADGYVVTASIKTSNSARRHLSRLLSGSKPSDLPVQTPTKFELLLNLKTAKKLDLVISPGLLAAAAEVAIRVALPN
jgi:putative ABC transport system substrate-binding protein